MPCSARYTFTHPSGEHGIPHGMWRVIKWTRVQDTGQCKPRLTIYDYQLSYLARNYGLALILSPDFPCESVRTSQLSSLGYAHQEGRRTVMSLVTVLAVSSDSTIRVTESLGERLARLLLFKSNRCIKVELPCCDVHTPLGPNRSLQRCNRS